MEQTHNKRPVNELFCFRNAVQINVCNIEHSSAAGNQLSFMLMAITLLSLLRLTSA